MSTTQLIEVFSSLTPLQQKEIVAKMKEMSRPASRGFPKELLDRINEGRERIRAENGELPDSTEFIRRCRDGDEYQPLLIVLDANVATKWFVPEKWEAEAKELLARFQTGEIQICAPDLIYPEVANALRHHMYGRNLTRRAALEAYAEFLLCPSREYPQVISPPTPLPSPSSTTAACSTRTTSRWPTDETASSLLLTSG